MAKAEHPGLVAQRELQFVHEHAYVALVGAITRYAGAQDPSVTGKCDLGDPDAPALEHARDECAGICCFAPEPVMREAHERERCVIHNAPPSLH